MPTGYTADVQSGKVTEFADYAMQCARAFGALITMRDDPLGTEIPEEFQPDTHYRDAVIEHNNKLKELESMTPEQADLAAAAAYTEAMKYHEETLAKKRETRKRYEAMLEKCQRFKPPTDEHKDFAKFLINQLNEAIDWDCGEDHITVPARKSSKEWLAERIEHTRDMLAYYIKNHEEEVERTRGRNEWIRQLRAAIAEVK